MAEATIACDGVPPDSWTAPEEESAAGGRLESGAVATLLVAAVVFINEASFRIPPTEESSLDWQVLLRLAVCGACGIYGLAHLRVAVQALERFPANLIVAFGTWSLVSVPFAVDIPYAVASCACLWCVILFAPAALQHLGLRRVLIVVLASLAAFAVGSWIMYFAVPSVGRTEFLNPDGEVVGRLGGLNHANGLGRQMSVMTMMVLLLGSQKMVRWRALLPWLVLALVTLAFTNSRTPMVATAAVAGFLFLRKVGFDVIMRKGWAMLALMGALAAVMVVGSDVTLLGAFSRSGEMEELYTFTGRTDVWHYAVDKICERPLTGYGCGCVRFPMCEYEAYPITHAHNLLLNTTLNIGIVGGMILGAMMLTQAAGLFRSPSIFPDTILVIILVLGFADTPMLNRVPDTLTLLWFMAILWRCSGPLPPTPQKEAVCEST